MPVAEAQYKPAYYELPDAQKQITLLDLFPAPMTTSISPEGLFHAHETKVCRRKFLADHKLEYNENMKVGEDFLSF